MMINVALCRVPSALAVAAALLMLCANAGPVGAAEPFTLFETGQVRPLALSPDGTLLFATNTPDNRPDGDDETDKSHFSQRNPL